MLAVPYDSSKGRVQGEQWRSCLQIVGNTLTDNCISGGVGGMGIDNSDGEIHHGLIL